MTNLPLASFDANRIWCSIVAPASDITAWMGMLALADHQARRWGPKKLRYRIFTIPATLARTGRRVLLHLSSRSHWAELTATALARLGALAPTRKPLHRPDNPAPRPDSETGAPERQAATNDLS